MAPSGRDTSERGPGWFDVAAYTRALEKQHGKFVVISTCVNTARNGAWGLHITARFKDEDMPRGYGCYGPSYPGNGQATMAAAMYHALLRFDHELCQAAILSTLEEQEEIPF